jgi:hypothetical protein
MALSSLVVAQVGWFGCAGWRDQGDCYYRHRLPLKRARTEASYCFGGPSEDWRPLREDIGKGMQVAWLEPRTVAFIQIHAQCDEHGDSSLEQYTDHLRIDWTDWNIIEQQPGKLVGREALRTLVDAELDGMPRRNEVWVVKKNGCIFDLIYSAPPEDFQAGRADFQRVVEGFQFPVD